MIQNNFRTLHLKVNAFSLGITLHYFLKFFIYCEGERNKQILDFSRTMACWMKCVWPENDVLHIGQSVTGSKVAQRKPHLNWLMVSLTYHSHAHRHLWKEQISLYKRINLVRNKITEIRIWHRRPHLFHVGTLFFVLMQVKHIKVFFCKAVNL